MLSQRRYLSPQTHNKLDNIPRFDLFNLLTSAALNFIFKSLLSFICKLWAAIFVIGLEVASLMTSAHVSYEPMLLLSPIYSHLRFSLGLPLSGFISLPLLNRLLALCSFSPVLGNQILGNRLPQLA